MVLKNRVQRFTILMLGLLVIAGSLALGACAPQANDNPAGGGEDETAAIQVAFSWSEESDCASCHTTESASLENGACVASRHADVACVSCHTDVAALAAVHEGATVEHAGRAALVATAVSSETCESCHSLADVAQKTADLAVLTDSAGTIVNPHALPESESHAELSCTSCHQMHVADANIEKKAQRACASCHHANVYECHTCHS